MKYRNFIRLMNANPDIQWLPEFIGSPRMRDSKNYSGWSRCTPWTNPGYDNVEMKRKRYIGEVVEFVDFRDWSKLDLSAPLSSARNMSLNGFHNPSREEVRYGVVYHLEGKTSCYIVDPQDAQNRSEWAQDLQRQLTGISMVRDLLEDYWIWSRRERDHDSREHKDVIFDAVVKITRIWDGDWECYSSEKVEIFRVPERLKPKPVWAKKPAAAKAA